MCHILYVTVYNGTVYLVTVDSVTVSHVTVDTVWYSHQHQFIRGCVAEAESDRCARSPHTSNALCGLGQRDEPVPDQ